MKMKFEVIIETDEARAREIEDAIKTNSSCLTLLNMDILFLFQLRILPDLTDKEISVVYKEP